MLSVFARILTTFDDSYLPGEWACIEVSKDEMSRWSSMFTVASQSVNGVASIILNKKVRFIKDICTYEGEVFEFLRNVPSGVCWLDFDWESVDEFSVCTQEDIDNTYVVVFENSFWLGAEGAYLERDIESYLILIPETE